MKLKDRWLFYVDIIGGIALTLFVLWVFVFNPGRIGRPNVVLILVDALRADYLGCYGHRTPTSPTLDTLAREGTLCEQVYAQRSITWPSVTSIMSSQYPATHGVRRNGEDMSPDLVTLASVLRKKGYRTAAFVANMLTSCHPGFQDFTATPVEIGNCERDDYVTQQTLNWLSRNGHERFFVYLHYMAPHKPYLPPKDYETQFDPDYQGWVDGREETLDRITLDKVDLTPRDVRHIQSLYEACVRYTDDRIAEVIEWLDQNGFAHNTLLVVVADHGEELFERNHYFYHGCSMYDSCLRVPLIFRWLGKIPEGVRLSRVRETIDLAPTVLNLLNVPVPDSFEGSPFTKSLIQGWDEEGTLGGRSFAEWQDKMATVRTERWRYVWNPSDIRPDGEPYATVQDERREGYYIPTAALYDRVKEATESTNLLDSNPKEASRLHAMIGEWTSQLNWTYRPSGIGQDQLQEIQGLGYVGAHTGTAVTPK